MKLERRETRSSSPAGDAAIEDEENGRSQRPNITRDEIELQRRSVDDEEGDNYEGEDDGESRGVRSSFPDDIANVEAYERLASRDKRKKRYGVSSTRLSAQASKPILMCRNRRMLEQSSRYQSSIL